MDFIDRMFRRTGAPRRARTPLYFFNTLGLEKQEFTMPPRTNEVRMYNCGPTVYGVQHIGNLSMFVFADVLRKTLEYNDFKVKQVINITDFGHLSGDNEGDADHGEDRMTKGLKREKLKVSMENMRLLADKYIAIFMDDIAKLNINTKKIGFPRASDYIPAQIAMVQTLEEKGYAYCTKDGVYFDTTRFSEYGKLGNINLAGLKEGARVEATSEKRTPTDFLLWKSDKKMGWDSPWGKGFPGWHIECSAMINSTLGKQIDIHTGGVEHIPVHHNNEIAQSESATGKKPLSRFWLHRAHVQIEGAKIAKSKENVVYLSEIIKKGFHPMALRYLYLGAHYRTNSNFTWDALEASQKALSRLLALRLSIKDASGKVPEKWRERFHERINDDLDTPGALGILWEMTKDESLAPPDMLAAIIDFDRVFNLGLTEPGADLKKLALSEMKIQLSPAEIPTEVQKLIEEREAARSKRDWQNADELRKQIDDLGYMVDDSEEGARVFKK